MFLRCLHFFIFILSLENPAVCFIQLCCGQDYLQEQVGFWRNLVWWVKDPLRVSHEFFFKPVFWSIKPKLGNGKALMSPPATGTTEIFAGCIPIFLLKSFLRSWESPLSGLTWGFDCWKIFVHFLFLPLDRIWWGLLNASLPNRSAFLFGTPVGGRSWTHLGQRPLGFSWNKEVK